MIRFESDYLEGAVPEIMSRLIETNYEQTAGYGTDPYCRAAREKIKLECDAFDADVHFLVGGTQANLTVIAAALRPHQGIMAAETAHIEAHETGAIEATGHKVITLPTVDGKINAADVRDCVLRHRADESFEHIVQPAMVYISQPTETGTALRRVLHRRNKARRSVRRSCRYQKCRDKKGLSLYHKAARRHVCQGQTSRASVRHTVYRRPVL